MKNQAKRRPDRFKATNVATSKCVKEGKTLGNSGVRRYSVGFEIDRQLSNESVVT
jgi:hypothetical protein